ncbi:MAG: hypothetical protein VX335_04205, partial [Pseudomonadota bacterium]|nr:hypothetical protein [Pseudomonadota bacterium]
SILATQPDLDKETKINLMSENITEPSDFCKKINDSLTDVNVRLFSAEGSSPEDILKLKSTLNKISDSGFSGDKENIVDLTLQLGELDNSKESLKFPRNQ